MHTQRLQKDKTDCIGKDALFAIIGRLSIQQRAVLSLRCIEDMNLKEVSYILDSGYAQVIWHILTARIKLKFLMVTGGHHTFPLKRFITVFGKLTSV
jgi:DNA-directed RNA polymerase specialized sigma24 family protein